MEKYETKHGNTLEVWDNGRDEYYSDEIHRYDFIIREKKPQGENVIVLMANATLSTTDYFVKKFKEEY